MVNIDAYTGSKVYAANDRNYKNIINDIRKIFL